MDHRTYGETRNCMGCRYWSEMVAAYGGGFDGAMCLAKNGPHKGKYKSGRMTCDSWKSGHLGAIDEPHSENLEMYAAEDSPHQRFDCWRCGGCGELDASAAPCPACGGHGWTTVEPESVVNE